MGTSKLPRTPRPLTGQLQLTRQTLYAVRGVLVALVITLSVLTWRAFTEPARVNRTVQHNIDVVSAKFAKDGLVDCAFYRDAAALPSLVAMAGTKPGPSIIRLASDASSAYVRKGCVPVLGAPPPIPVILPATPTPAPTTARPGAR